MTSRAAFAVYLSGRDHSQRSMGAGYDHSALGGTVIEPLYVIMETRLKPATPALYIQSNCSIIKQITNYIHSKRFSQSNRDERGNRFKADAVPPL